MFKLIRCVRVCVLALLCLCLLLLVSFRKNLKVNNLQLLNKNLTDHTSMVKGIPTLLWWSSVYRSVDDTRQCGQFQCRVTNNRTLIQDSNTRVIVFYGSRFEPYDLPLPRKEHHIWALSHEESPRNNYLFSHQSAIRIFNFTSTFKSTSDYPTTTQWLNCPNWLQDSDLVISLEKKNRLQEIEGLAPVLYIQSDCGVPSDRDHFVSMLQKFVSIDSYGTCLNNKKLPETLQFRDTMAPLDDIEFYKFTAQYKFTIAMENAVCDDYVTEKLWRPLRVGSVPVAFGAPNIRKYLPDNHSAILIEDFNNMEELADYINYLDDNDEKYAEFLQFKTKDRPIANEFLIQELTSRDWEPLECNNGQQKKSVSNVFFGFDCFLCRKAHEFNTGLEKGLKPPLSIASVKHYDCPKPKRFNDKGSYVIEDEVWSEEWWFGKRQAQALWTIHERNRPITKSEYVNLLKATL